MPRQLRIEYPGATYHVMARGNRRNAIFRDDQDCEAFLGRLDTACGKTGWEVRAFVLMGNHYHLVLHTPKGNLVEGMKWLQNAYTRYFNVRHQLWGRVFGDRYKSVLVEEEHSFGGRGAARGDYLTTLIDYVHLNPARAGLIDPGRKESLLDYPWSSVARAYAVAPSKRKRWMDVATGFDLAQCRDTVAGRRQYVERLDARALAEKSEAAGLSVPEIEGQTLNSTLRRGWYWGSEAFREWLLEKAGSGSRSNRDFRGSEMGHDHSEAAAEAMIAEGCIALKLDGKTELKKRVYGDWRRTAIAWAVWKSTSVSQKWIAERLGMKSAANVSQQVRRFDGLNDRELPKEIKRWKRNVRN
jgi:putative transposase